MLKFSSVHKYKAADTSRSLTTSRSADPDMQFPIVGGETYVAEFFITIDASAAGDLSFSFSLGGGTLNRGSLYAERYGSNDSSVNGNAGYPCDGSLITAFAVSTVAGNDTANYVEYLHVTVCLDVATSGTFSFDWAQATSDAAASVVKAGSQLFYERVA